MTEIVSEGPVAGHQAGGLLPGAAHPLKDVGRPAARLLTGPHDHHVAVDGDSVAKGGVGLTRVGGDFLELAELGLPDERQQGEPSGQ